MTTLPEQIRDILAEKNEGVDWFRVVGRWPRLYYTQPCFMSHVSWTALKGDWRYVLDSHLIKFMGQRATPGMIAREYLALKYKLPLKARGAQIVDAREYRSVPLYASRGEYGYGFYLDLKAAYWNLMLAAGWDVDYRPLKYLGTGTPPDDFPLPNHKVARNALASVGVSSDLMMWDGFKILSIKAGNRYRNRLLQAFILDTLNGIAFDMVLAGAVYVNTDGYIIPAERYEAAADALNAWGLPWSVKAQGDVSVFGVGSYQVGEAKTKHIWHAAQDVAKIDGQHADFLRKRVRWAAERRGIKP